jgi:hypothetical protein
MYKVLVHRTEAQTGSREPVSLTYHNEGFSMAKGCRVVQCREK